MAPPKFVKFLGVDTAVTDSVSLKFLGADGNGYTAQIVPAAVPATIAALISMGGNISGSHPVSKSQPANVQPLLPTGFHIGANENGDPVIYFQFGPAGSMPILLTRNQLADVQRLIAELVRLSEPKGGGHSH